MSGREKIEHGDDSSEALKSPFSRVYLCPESEQIINCTMGLQNPIDIEALKKVFSTSIMLKHPRFCSLMSKNHKGHDCWEKTHVNVDDHVIIHPTTSTTMAEEEEDEADIINSYLADISVSSPLSKNKPLWEIHVLRGMKFVVLRVHHALGDGASLMSMLSACFGTTDHNNVGKEEDGHAIRKMRKWKEKSVWGFGKSLWFTLVFGWRFLGKLLWVKDMESVISGGDGVELWPRMLVTAKFKLQDFKLVKNAIPSATINDVLLGIISSGLSKYMQIKSPKAMLQGLQLTAIVVVNLRKHQVGTSSIISSSTSSWGNKTGLILQPVYCCHGLHPLEHLKNMKAIIDEKKQSFEAHLPYIFLKFMIASFGPKVASWCSKRVLCNTSLLLSNIMGPSEVLMIGDNPVTSLRVNISAQPQALTMHLVSYGGNADLQVMVAKDIIHDPQFLANCFQESLDEMKNCISLNQENKQISACDVNHITG